jgi:endonuclease/exonuclease/phosphatase family metal-dependent hydrolase
VADVKPRIFDIRLCAALLLALLTAIPAAAGEPGQRLDIASYNVQFVMPEVPVLGHLLRDLPGQKPNVELRARAIGAALACFDVIALQETINDRRRAELLDQLEAAGKNCGKSSRLPSGRMFETVAGPNLPDGSAWLPLLDDELALASRLPLLSVDMHAFEAAAGTDALAAKGVLHARLALGPHSADVLDVFTTHLQADAEQADVRKRQIEELAAFVHSQSSAPAPVLVMGDFNLWGGAVDRADSKSEYNFLLEALNAAVAPRRFVDLWLATHASDPETASGTKPRVLADGSIRPREKRIDFLLLAGADQAQPLGMRRDFLPSELVVDGQPLGDLSNHAALMAETQFYGASHLLALFPMEPASSMTGSSREEPSIDK